MTREKNMIEREFRGGVEEISRIFVLCYVCAMSVFDCPVS